MNKLRGRLVLVTGATSGIGEACAILFASEGADVIVVGRNEQNGEKVVNIIKNGGGYAEFCKCDVTSYDAVENLANYIAVKYGKLDILVNNAGVLITGTIEEMTEEEWDIVHDTNFRSTVRVTKAFLPLVLKVKGNILNVASVEGLDARTAGRASYAYATSKTAQVKFTKLMAMNYARQIRVNALCPGITDTNIYTNKDYSRFSDIPMGRVAVPVEIAKVALFIVSDDASYMTGAVVVVDGGFSLR